MHTSPFPPARPPAAPRPAGPGWTHRLGWSLWWSVTGVLTTLGVAAAFVLIGAIGALVIIGVATAGTTLVRVQLRQSPDGRRTWPAVLDLLGGWCVVALVGLAAEFGAAGLGASAAVVAVRVLAMRRGRLPQPSEVPTLTTPQLCRTWRLTYAGMQRPDCSAHRLEQLTGLRSACLDELERRDPSAFQRWLPTARAAGDPARFFCPQSDG